MRAMSRPATGLGPIGRATYMKTAGMKVHVR